MKRETEARDMGFPDMPENTGVTKADFRRGYLSTSQPYSERTQARMAMDREFMSVFEPIEKRGPRNTGFLGSRDYFRQEDEV